jgi:two-component system cell cycle sensor histidine kinase/response regulator CckA
MPAASATGTTRVLIVDDNPIDREIFKRLLQNQSAHEFRCIEGEHGRAGVEQFRRERPDCVILDLNLPDIDGLDLLKAFLAEPDACPVIVTTAYGSEQVAVDAMKSGAADYIVKGSTSGEALAHTIQNAIEKCGLVRQVERQRLAIEERNRELEAALARERAARNAVEQSENRYRTLAEAMPQIVWTAIHPSGDLDYINERWSRLTGAPAATALGRGWLEYLVPEDVPAVADCWRDSLSSVVPLEVEGRIGGDGQTPRWQLIRALPLMQDGGPVKWLGTFTDVEDQRRTEQLLHHRQKLESIGILAGGVAHDFNNLLVGIIGGVSYALDVLPQNHELTPLLEGALKSGERAAHLTRQMLAYAGKGRFLLENVDVTEVLQSTCELIKASIPKSVDLKLLVRPDLPRVLTDASQLQQIIMNLIINAAEAIPADRQGLIMARTDQQRVEAGRSIWTSDLKTGRYVLLEVRDNGSGIDRAVLGKIFDPFFSTKFTGRGLGLAAVQGIVRSNKGAIEVESEPGKGSVFRVFLPAALETAGASRPEMAAGVAAPPRARILVVDDEPIVCRTAAAALERAGHYVEAVPGGREALDVLAAATDAFSLVLLDLSMPGLDGERTLEEIRRMAPTLPVVICSGFSDAEIRTRFQGKAINGFLQKPFHARAICEKVAAVLESV